MVSAACATLLLCRPALADADTPTVVKPRDLDSRGAVAVRKLSKDVINAPRPKRFSIESLRDEGRADKGTIDEILVTGERDPEDAARERRTPLQRFRDKLEREQRMTPKDKLQLALCIIGLCGKYGDDGAPVEDRSFTRSERAALRSSLEMSQQFRGTLQ